MSAIVSMILAVASLRRVAQPLAGRVDEPVRERVGEKAQDLVLALAVGEHQPGLFERALARAIRVFAQAADERRCGPQVWLKFSTYIPMARKEAAFQLAREMLFAGKILAVKGLGGFHLACDATNRSAVVELRQRKLRIDKPFALMLPDLRTVEKHCFVDGYSRILLTSHQRPVVILQRRPKSQIAREVAPEQDTIGVMLPYTPLHYLLFANETTRSDHHNFDELCLVMTSGNLSEEPIATDNRGGPSSTVQFSGRLFVSRSFNSYSL